MWHELIIIAKCGGTFVILHPVATAVHMYMLYISSIYEIKPVPDLFSHFPRSHDVEKQWPSCLCFYLHGWINSLTSGHHVRTDAPNAPNAPRPAILADSAVGVGALYRCITSSRSGKSKYWYDCSELKPIWLWLICQGEHGRPTGLNRNPLGTFVTSVNVQHVFLFWTWTCFLNKFIDLHVWLFHLLAQVLNDQSGGKSTDKCRRKLNCCCILWPTFPFRCLCAVNHWWKSLSQEITLTH